MKEEDIVTVADFLLKIYLYCSEGFWKICQKLVDFFQQFGEDEQMKEVGEQSTSFRKTVLFQM